MFFLIFGSIVLVWTVIRAAIAIRKFGVSGLLDSRPLTGSLSLWLTTGVVTLAGGLMSTDSRILAVTTTFLLIADVVLRKLVQPHR